MAPDSRASIDDLTLGQLFARGSASLGAATLLQRALSFVATILAARIGGPAVFGGYSIGVSTAGLAASYLGLGAGATATRYIAQVPRNTRAYASILKRLAGTVTISSVAAGLLMFMAAEPVARLVLQDVALAGIVRAAALAAVAFILFEAINGVAIGLLHFRSVLMLVGLAGAGSLIALPLASTRGASAMLLAQAVATLVAIAGTLAWNWRALGPIDETMAAEGDAIPTGRRLLLFGMTQLGASALLTFVSWWIAVLLVRHDPSLTVMAFYGVGNQLRALVALVPTQISSLVVPLLVRFSHAQGDQDRVVTASTFVTVAGSVTIGGLLLAGLPWVIALYGPKYQGALVTASLLVATAVVHMGGTPVVNALVVASLRRFAIVTTFGCLTLFVLAIWLVPRYGAVGAGAAWLAAHLTSQPVANALLARSKRLPGRVTAFWALGAASIVALALLAIGRATVAGAQWRFLVAQLILLGMIGAGVWRVAVRMRYVEPGLRALLLHLRGVPGLGWRQ